jgi:hypothetical protein
MISSKGVRMNIFDIKEAKIKSYLKYLHNQGATSKGKAVKIDDVERALRIDDNLFDEITKYVLAEGFAQRAVPRAIYLTKVGVNKLKG